MKDVVIAVDFDGTCVTHAFPKVGADVGAAPVLRRILNEGGHIILWTMRSGKLLDDALRWFVDNAIPLYGVQHNPTQDQWTQSPKAYAHIYIDDAALGCPLVRTAPDSKPYVDWEAVQRILWPGENDKVERFDP